jgi:copper chaperone NosL
MIKCIWWLPLVIVFACGKGPEPIQYGKDQCEFCKMTISDPKFGAETVTSQGRVYKYDAIECMINAMKEDRKENSQVLATPYDLPHTLMSKDSLVFVFSPEIHSPMGANLAAFRNRSTAISLFGEETEIVAWDKIFTKINH